MEITQSNGKSGNDSPLIWRRPNDMRELEKIWPVTKRQFSLELLKSRFRQMDRETQFRAIKVMDALKTGLPCQL